MQSFQLVFALFIATLLGFTCATNFEWQPEVDVEIPANAVVHPPNALRRAQATTDFSSTGSATTFDGSVGDDKSESKSAGSDSVGDEATSSASGRDFGVATVLTAFTVLLALVMA
jgi:hypothetical protein